MKIQMICVGKIKEAYLRELIDHYTKIIRKKYDFEIIELPSIQRGITKDPSGILSRFLCPSISLIFASSFSLVLSGVFSSGSSIISKTYENPNDLRRKN